VARSKTPDALREYRKKFFAGKADEDHPEYSHLYDSWKKTELLGIDTRIDGAPLSARNQDAQLPMEKKHTFDVLGTIVEKGFSLEQRLLEHFNIAVYVAADFESDLLIFGRAGKTELLNSLSLLGIGIGTSVFEGLAGTVPISKTLHLKSPVWTIGPENYYEFLGDYAVFSSQVSDMAIGFMQLRFVHIYIVPLTHFSETTKNYIEFSSERLSYSSEPSLLPQVIIKNKAFDDFLKRNEIALLITNKHDVIIDASTHCKNLLGKGYFDCCGQKYYDLFPELQSVDPSGKKKRWSRKAVRLATGTEVILEVRPSTFSGKLLGYTIIATDANRVRDNAKADADIKAHYSFQDIISTTKTMKDLKETAKKAAQSVSSVLICGEAGTGKELFAHAIHKASPRYNEPFIAVNCGGLIDTKIESTLFGNAENTSSDAQGDEPAGMMELAQGGTIFFIDIDELPLHIQSLLAGVLRAGHLTHKGSNREHHFDVRVIASSKKNLYEATRKGTFRPELFYCLNVISFIVPPLRDRQDDIPRLVRMFINYFNRNLGKKIQGISDEALNCLLVYSWPGNVRELRNVIEQAVNLETDRMISYHILPSDIKTPNREDSAFEWASETKEVQSYRESELNRIKLLMFKYNGNKSRVASELGITRSTLYRKLKNITDWN